MEFRLEGLAYQENAARRHIMQALTEFRMSKAGDRGVEVMDSWIQDVARAWVQARTWIKDVKPADFGKEWKVICRGAIEDSWKHFEALKWEASQITEREGEIKDAKALEEVCKEIKENLEVHMKACHFILREESQGKYEAEVTERIFKALTNLA